MTHNTMANLQRQIDELRDVIAELKSTGLDAVSITRLEAIAYNLEFELDRLEQEVPRVTDI